MLFDRGVASPTRVIGWFGWGSGSSHWRSRVGHETPGKTLARSWAPQSAVWSPSSFRSFEAPSFLAPWSRGSVRHGFSRHGRQSFSRQWRGRHDDWNDGGGGGAAGRGGGARRSGRRRGGVGRGGAGTVGNLACADPDPVGRRWSRRNAPSPESTNGGAPALPNIARRRAARCRTSLNGEDRCRRPPTSWRLDSVDHRW